jgi:hypothetical protein
MASCTRSLRRGKGGDEEILTQPDVYEPSLTAPEDSARSCAGFLWNTYKVNLKKLS